MRKLNFYLILCLLFAFIGIAYANTGAWDSIKTFMEAPGPIGATTPSTGAFTDLGATGTLSGRLNRDFSKLNMTNGDTQTAITETQMLSNKWVSNQGDTVETDIQFPVLSYTISGGLLNEEALVMEICPPAGEIMYLDGVAMDANDCVDSDGTVGSMAAYIRFQDASGTWHYGIISSIGLWSDTGATD